MGGANVPNRRQSPGALPYDDPLPGTRQPGSPTSGPAPVNRPPQQQAKKPTRPGTRAPVRPAESAPPTSPEFSPLGRIDYGGPGGIPQDALKLAGGLFDRGETLKDRQLERELLSFGGGDEFSSPMARFEGLRDAELSSELNNSILSLLHGSAESSRDRTLQEGLQERGLHSSRFLQDQGLTHQAQQGYFGRQHAAGAQDQDLANRRFQQEAGQQHDLTREEIANQRFNERQQERLLMALLGLSPSSAGDSSSGGFSFGLPTFGG